MVEIPAKTKTRKKFQQIARTESFPKLSYFTMMESTVSSFQYLPKHGGNFTDFTSVRPSSTLFSSLLSTSRLVNLLPISFFPLAYDRSFTDDVVPQQTVHGSSSDLDLPREQYRISISPSRVLNLSRSRQKSTEKKTKVSTTTIKKPSRVNKVPTKINMMERVNTRRRKRTRRGTRKMRMTMQATSIRRVIFPVL
jgi:hypothetical protein